MFTAPVFGGSHHHYIRFPDGIIGRYTDVGHAVFPVAALALTPIRQAGADVSQLGDQRSQGVHGGIESETRPRRQPKPAFAMS